MKTPSVFILGAIALSALITASPVRAQAMNDLVRVEVQAKLGQDRKDIKGTTAKTSTQTITLGILVRGKAMNPESRTATWTVYGRDLENKTLSTLGTGTFQIALSATGDQKAESDPVSTTFTPAYTVVERGGGQNQNPRARKVAAQGVKYLGYGVVVKAGDKIVGEFYSQPGFKEK